MQLGRLLIVANCLLSAALKINCLIFEKIHICKHIFRHLLNKQRVVMFRVLKMGSIGIIHHAVFCWEQKGIEIMVSN